ncbi:MAG: hypothetical protein Tsb0010_10490 [Parvularculaceae bacterium]
MRGLKTPARLSGAAACALMIAAPGWAQINSYRFETEDCPGCGQVQFSSIDEATAYFDYIRAVMDGNGDNGFAFGHDEDDDDDDDDEQVIFLDFDAGGAPTFPVCRTDGTVFGIFQDHVYTQAERDEITARIAADYAEFDYEVTQTLPTEGDFTTVFFGMNDAPLDCSGGSNITVTPTGGVSILFGQADSIDFLNSNRNDNAFADASFWEFLAQLDPSGGLFSALSGLDLADFGGDLQAAVSAAVVNQSSNTGAHEAGHLQGLRHQNSFGAPGDGIPSTGVPGPNDFVPVFDGGANATETVLHTMASGASVGLTLQGSTITDRFFSERSAVRIALGEDGRTITEAQAAVRNKINLHRLKTPNTIESGVNADARLRVKALVVDGAIDAFGEVDSYFFRGKEGDFFNAELISVIGRSLSFADGIIGQLRLYQVHNDGSETLIASNLQSFESVFDAEIFDALLPANSLYRVEVSAPDEFFPVDFDGDGVLDPFPLSLAGGADLVVGQYSLQVYTCNKKLRGRDRDDDDDDDDDDGAVADDD